jgi:hypothetical protein
MATGVITPTATTPGENLPAQPGEMLTRRVVTAITAAIVVMTFAFSLGNVTRLCLHLGITAWIAWLVGPAVDLSVVGLLTGMRSLSLHGYTPTELQHYSKPQEIEKKKSSRAASNESR